MLATLGAGILTLVGLRRRSRGKGMPPPDSAEIARRVARGAVEGQLGRHRDPCLPRLRRTRSGCAGSIRGPAGVRANIERYLTSFPDAAITADDQFAVNGKVATRWTARGTQTGEIAGIAPTGRQVTVSGLTVMRLDDGMVVEDWTTWDALGMLVQLGAVATLAPA